MSVAIPVAMPGSVAKVLLVGSSVSDAELLLAALQDEPLLIVTARDVSTLVEDFERCLPDVLLLAPRSLRETQDLSDALYLCSEVARAHPHRTLVLCHADEAAQTYALCKQGGFDDYIKYWPHTFDVHQLPMRVNEAVRQLHAARALREAAAELMEFANRTAATDLLLAPGSSSNTPGPVQVLQHKMWAALQSGAAPERAALSLKTSLDQASAVTALSVDLRKQSIAHTNMLRVLRDRGQAPPASAETHKAGSVLIVEDDPFQQKMITRIVQQEQVSTDCALNAKEAMELLQKRTPALILLDYELPDCNGVTLLNMIRRNPAWSQVPVIMLTGNSDREIVLASLQAGATDFIVKPVDPAKLREKVRRFAGTAG